MKTAWVWQPKCRLFFVLTFDCVPSTDAASNKLQGSNVFTIAKRTVDGQDMLYQSLKLTNGIWVLAELRVQAGNPNYTVSAAWAVLSDVTVYQLAMTTLYFLYQILVEQSWPTHKERLQAAHITWTHLLTLLYLSRDQQDSKLDFYFLEQKNQIDQVSCHKLCFTHFSHVSLISSWF